LVIGHWSFAQIPAPPVASSEVLQKIGIDQNLNTQIPLDLVFRNELGKEVQLKDLINGKPTVLSLVYYRCPMLCTMTLNGMSSAFKPLKLDVGRDFNVITVSFDPRETPHLAADKKRAYLKEYNRSGAENGWHFLTGDQKSIATLAQSCGFRYYYDPKTNQYAHASGIMIITPDGRLSRYFYGLEYSANDLRLGLVEASGNKIGTPADQLMLLCYQYDPTSGRYGFAVIRAVQLGGIITVAAITTFIVVALKREKRRIARLQISNLRSGISNPS
jgi:protein SCO1